MAVLVFFFVLVLNLLSVCGGSIVVAFAFSFSITDYLFLRLVAAVVGRWVGID